MSLTSETFREFLLERIDELDQFYETCDPHAVVEAGRRYAATAEAAGHQAATLGHPDLYRRSLTFGEFAEWPQVKGYLSECLAAIGSGTDTGPTGDMLTVDDVARLLGIDKRTVWRRRSDGTLPEPMKIGRLVRWNREEFKTWMKSN